MKHAIIATLFIWCLVPVGAWAQGFGLLDEQIELQIKPRIIEANKMVSFELISYATDIDRAYVIVSADGEVQQEGVGIRQFQILAPDVGISRLVAVEVRTIDKGTVSKQIILHPSRVDLLYEAVNSFAPPLYQGKRLPAHEGGVRVVALPYFIDTAGLKIDSASLIYTWQLDDQVQTSASGYGRTVFSFAGSSRYRTRSVSVRVEDISGDLIARRNIEIPAYDPVVRFYQEHPLWGADYSRAITNIEPIELDVPEFTVRATPFFISDSDSLDLVEYDWRINGQPITSLNDRNIINLRAPDGEAGRSEINLKITHREKFLQLAKSVFTVLFGQEGTNTRGGASSGGTSNLFGKE